MRGIEADTRRTMIRGIVAPVDWDEKGNVLAFAVLTDNEDEYRVIRDRKGNELLRLMRKAVEVSGLVDVGEKKKSIKVLHFKQLKDLRTPQPK